MKTITIAILITILAVKLGGKVIDKHVQQAVRVDTVRVESTVHRNDTVTVISRAADTVRVYVKQVGPLTQADLVRVICGNYKNSGRFDFNAYGPEGASMVFCPEEEKP